MDFTEEIKKLEDRKNKKKDYIKGYYDKNKEKIKEKNKEKSKIYYSNPEKREQRKVYNRERAKELIKCDVCNIDIKRGNKQSHKISNRHIENLKKKL